MTTPAEPARVDHEVVVGDTREHAVQGGNNPMINDGRLMRGAGRERG
jgi:hypothetical protein